jgi:hypothetical protein
MNALSLHAVVITVILAGAGRPAVAAEPAPFGAASRLRCHFVGTDKLFADTNAAKLKQIWSLPSSGDVRRQFLDQLARVPRLALGNLVGPGMADQATLLRPLLDDLWPNESFLEWKTQPDEFVLAIQLSDARARVWSQSLRQAVTAWKLGAITPDKTPAAGGWTLKTRDGTAGLAFARAGQWVVVGLGSGALPLHGQVVQRIAADGRPGPKPTGFWLEADANLERLKPWLPPLAPYPHPPVAHLTLSNRADNVHTTVRLEFAQGHGWKSEPWSVPVGLVRDPLTSFAAVRGIGPLLQAWLQQLQIQPSPSQIILWANAQMPFLTQAAVPVPRAEAQLTRATPVLAGMVLSNNWVHTPGSVTWDTNLHGLLWRGLPIAMPHISVATNGPQEWLLAGLFPRPPLPKPVPPELLKQLDRDNLVYYGWETTDRRLQQWRPLYQLTDIAAERTWPGTNAPTQRWLLAVGPLLLRNTVTEITATSPTELTLVRTSQVGLTGFELVSFTRWLDSPAFPAFNVAGKPKPSRVHPPGKETSPKK